MHVQASKKSQFKLNFFTNVKTTRNIFLLHSYFDYFFKFNYFRANRNVGQNYEKKLSTLYY